jgi:hypothetical protein
MAGASGVASATRRRFPRDPTLPVVQDHARRMFRAFESAIFPSIPPIFPSMMLRNSETENNQFIIKSEFVLSLKCFSIDCLIM